MLESILLAITLLFSPQSARAAELDPTVTQSTDQSAPANDPAGQGLGPATSSSGAGGSNADGGALQPAGTSTLQPGGSASGLTAPNSSTLQAPASADETLKVLAGEADGSPQQLDPTNPSLLQWLLTSLVIALLFAAIGIVWWRDRRPEPEANDQAEELPASQEPSDGEPDAETPAEATNSDEDQAEETAKNDADNSTEPAKPADTVDTPKHVADTPSKSDSQAKGD